MLKCKMQTNYSLFWFNLLHACNAMGQIAACVQLVFPLQFFGMFWYDAHWWFILRCIFLFIWCRFSGKHLCDVIASQRQNYIYSICYDSFAFPYWQKAPTMQYVFVFLTIFISQKILNVNYYEVKHQL